MQVILYSIQHHQFGGVVIDSTQRAVKRMCTGGQQVATLCQQLQVAKVEAAETVSVRRHWQKNGEHNTLSLRMTHQQTLKGKPGFLV